MLPNRDTMEGKEVTLADMVDLARDCEGLCRSKTHRVLENRSRSPRGWEKEYDDVAKKFQAHEYEQCVDSCSRVRRQCPEAHLVRQYIGQSLPELPSVPKDSAKTWWQFWKKEAQHAPSQPAHHTPVVTEHEIAVCENVAGDFSNVLFMLAHKPTKVQFHTYDPKTGDSYNPDTGEWITRNNSGQTSKEITAMLVDRWNVGLHGKNNAKSMPVGYEADVTSQSTGGRPQVPQPPEDPNVHGTVPRF